MNPYTSIWTGVTAGDGPQAFHLILLDNGRTDVLSDSTGRQALRCIRCSACLNVCPVYERTGGQAYGSVYPGPIGAILTPQLRGIANHPVDKQTASLPYASSLCGACFDVCPVRIDIPEVLVHLRGQVVRQSEATHRLPTPEALGMRAAAWTLRTPRRLGAAERVAGISAAHSDGAGGCGGCPVRARSRAGSGRVTSRPRLASRSVPGGSARTADGRAIDGRPGPGRNRARRRPDADPRRARGRPACRHGAARLRTCPPAGHGHRRALRRARQRLPSDRASDDRRGAARRHRLGIGSARGAAHRRARRHAGRLACGDRRRSCSRTNRR